MSSKAVPIAIAVLIVIVVIVAIVVNRKELFSTSSMVNTVFIKNFSGFTMELVDDTNGVSFISEGKEMILTIGDGQFKWKLEKPGSTWTAVLFVGKAFYISIDGKLVGVSGNEYGNTKFTFRSMVDVDLIVNGYRVNRHQSIMFRNIPVGKEFLIKPADNPSKTYAKYIWDGSPNVWYFGPNLITNSPFSVIDRFNVNGKSIPLGALIRRGGSGVTYPFNGGTLYLHPSFVLAQAGGTSTIQLMDTTANKPIGPEVTIGDLSGQMYARVSGINNK